MCMRCPHSHIHLHAHPPTHTQNRYIIYVIKDDKIQIEKQGAREKTWDDFTADLPETDCRYAVIDVEFETDDGRPTSKIVFLSWAPDSAKVCVCECACVCVCVWDD